MQKTKQLKKIKHKSVKQIILASLEDAKAIEVAVLNVSHLTSITDYMIICNGTSGRHMSTIAHKAMQAVKDAGLSVFNVEGLGSSDWSIVDCGDVVLHIMNSDSRAFYYLEGLWGIREAAE